MNAILIALTRPLIDAALSAFGHVLLDLFRTWKASADAQARGYAEARADAAREAARIERDMGGVGLPETDDMLRRLREGTA